MRVLLRLILFSITSSMVPGQAAATCSGRWPGHSSFSSIPNEWRVQIRDAFNDAKKFYYNGDQTLVRQGRATHNSRLDRSIGGIGLAKRLSYGEDHATWLFKLGFKKKTRVSDGQDILVAPASFEVLYENIEKEVSNLIESKEISEAQTIRPALSFVKKSENGGAFIFVRPGIDPWPDPEEHSLIANLPQIRHQFWEQAVAQGKMPISLQDLFDHDIAHFTEYLSSPTIMKETRAYYTRISKLTRLARQNFVRSESGRLFSERVLYIGEFFAVPNLSQRHLTRGSFPELFENNEIEDLTTDKTRLERLPFADLMSKGGKLIEIFDKAIIRIGGATRDSYIQVVNSQDGYWKKLVEQKTLNADTDIFFMKYYLEEKFFHNPFAAKYELKEILNQIQDAHDRRDFRQKGILLPLLIDKLSRARLFFANGIKMGITREDIVRDSSQLEVDLNSKTSRWLATFLDPKTAIFQAFLAGMSEPR